MRVIKVAAIACVLLVAFTRSEAARFNAFGMNLYTVETDHFSIHYHQGLEHLVKRVAYRLESLHKTFANTYHIKVPSKTDVILYDNDMPDGFAYPPLNTIFIGTHNFDFNLRGTNEWFDDVVTHEYSHIVSIWTSFKFPSWIPHLQMGSFSHPNQKLRSEAIHVFPTEILPQWFTEGIAQYDALLHGSERWDSHRDMILRTAVLSNNPLTWDHMHVFTGRGDDYEKTYNHGFSLVKYIAEKYGYEKVVSLLRESSKRYRLSFDRSIKAVLGITGAELYTDWIRHLEEKYRKQIREIGEQVYGTKINEHGFSNYRPRFSHDDNKIFFLSNGLHEYSFHSLYSYALCDTLEDDDRIESQMYIRGNYDIHPTGNFISYKSAESRRSARPPSEGGQRTLDLYIDNFETKKPSLFRRKTHRQITEQKSIFASSFSPGGDLLAVAQRKLDKYTLALIDTSGEHFTTVYPKRDSDQKAFSSIFNVAWSPDGKSIAVDFFDYTNRQIGIYDTSSGTFSVLLPSEHDQREPAFSSDGSSIYFASNKTGIFNIYRYTFATAELEKLTNVSGGAFSPSVNSDNTKLVYAGYDKDGYSIYLIDSINPLSLAIVEEGLAERDVAEIVVPQVAISNPRKYSGIPRQFLFVPTQLIEQVLTLDGDDFDTGVSNYKLGAVINLLDPFAWGGLGTEIGAFLFSEPTLSFISLDQGGFNTRTSFDIGAFATTRILPVDITVDYIFRGVAGENWFFDLSEDAYLNLPYNVRLHNFLFMVSHFQNARAFTQTPQGLTFNLFTGFDRYNVALNLNDAYGAGIFKYNLSKGVRVGSMINHLSRVIDPRMSISPKGLAAKLQYDFWNQHSLKEENSFDTTSSYLKEEYDTYRFHQFNAKAYTGISAPWYGKHDLHLGLSGSYLLPVGDQQIPSFYQPAAWIPGYTYYYRYSEEEQYGEEGNRRTVYYDTVLVSGKAVISGELSYRFPLWRGMINRRFFLLHYEHLYGAFNFSAGGGWNNPSDILELDRSDWIFAYGAEVRLEAISFNTYPVAMKFRWDYGADRPDPIGGHRFTFSLGFGFDSWGNVLYPDYHSSRKHNPGQPYNFRLGK